MGPHLLTPPRLAAALIVRDEEDFLGDCLKSLEGVVDEIVVVDTGSLDRTREIAEDAGARLLQHAWRDDFAAARNAALEACSSDWILYIDADERVISGGGDVFRRQLRDPRFVGLTVRFRPATGFTFYREPRLFRRHPDVRFRGVIHETHLPDLYRLARREGKTIGHGDLALHHLGYDGDMSHKHLRNLPLLEARVREDPEHVYSWWHLGNTFAALGRHADAKAAWRDGLEASRRAAGTSGVRYLPHLALLEHGLKHRGRLEEALWAEAWELSPDHPLLLWIRARHRIEQGRFAEAIPDLEHVAATPLDEEVAQQFATEERLFHVAAPAALANCYFQTGRYPEAERLYGQLADAVPGQEFEIKRRLAAIRGRPKRDSRRAAGACGPGALLEEDVAPGDG